MHSPQHACPAGSPPAAGANRAATGRPATRGEPDGHAAALVPIIVRTARTLTPAARGYRARTAERVLEKGAYRSSAVVPRVRRAATGWSAPVAARDATTHVAACPGS